MKECYNENGAPLGEATAQYFQQEIEAHENKSLVIHEEGISHDIGKYVVDNWVSIMQRRFKSLEDNPFKETKAVALQNRIPRLDQIPLAQGTICKMPREQREMLKGSIYEQAAFLY